LSYVVSLRRDVAITGEELQSAIQDDSEFTISNSAVEPAGDVMEMVWKLNEDIDAEVFVLSQGVVDVSTPSNSALIKMQAVAEILGARVVGEEGEELTDVEVSDAVPGGCGPVTWTILIVLVFLAGYWFLH
jgi:hypothetical protein